MYISGIVLCNPDVYIQKLSVDIFFSYGFIYPEAKCSFFFSSSPMDTTKSYMGVLGEIDVWDGLDDVDLEQSISYNALDNEHMAHECSETFSTNEVWSML